MNVEGKTIWITGASSGIGEALAKQLAEQGAKLILSARRKEVLESLKATLPNPDLHKVVPLDLAECEGLFDIVEKTLAEVGNLDVLVNNGGVSQVATTNDTDFALYRRLMNVNFFGTVAMTKAVLPHMLEKKQGMIVSIASVAAKVGTQQRSAYSASKHAVIGFMDSLRGEVHKEGIKVVVVCPGWVKTNVSLNSLDANGNPENIMDKTIETGISAESCASAVIKAMRKEKAEIVVGKGIIRVAPLGKRLVPGIMNIITRNQVFR